MRKKKKIWRAQSKRAEREINASSRQHEKRERERKRQGL